MFIQYVWAPGRTICGEYHVTLENDEKVLNIVANFANKVYFKLTVMSSAQRVSDCMKN
jgi:hypothetical protein